MSTITKRNNIILNYITNFFMESSTIKKKAGRCEFLIGFLLYAIMISSVSVLIGENHLAYAIAFLIISIPMFSLICRRYNDVGLNYKNSIKILAVFAVAAIGMVLVSIIAPLTPGGKSFFNQASGNIGAYINLSNYSDEMIPAFVICLVFVASLIITLIVQLVILFSKGNKFNPESNIFNVGFVSAVVCAISSVVFISSVYALTFKAFDKAKDDFLQSGFEIKEENLLGEDIIVQSGVFTPGIETDTIDSIKSYYDNDMKNALDGQYDYYKIGRFQVDNGIYVCPIFSQNVMNGDNVTGLIELCFVNSNDSEKEITIDKISIDNKVSDIGLKVSLNPGLNFVPVETDKINGGEPFQFKVEGFNVITSLTNIEDIARQQEQE